MTFCHYFAYGSNMNLGQMARRCPRARVVGPAILPGWRLAERLHADVEEAPGATVDGLVWQLTPECLHALDLYEGYPLYYLRQRVTAYHQGQPLPGTWVYRMTAAARSVKGRRPFSPGYAAACAQGAYENGVPVHPLYLERLHQDCP